MQGSTREQLFGRYRTIMDSGQDEWAHEPYECPVSEYVSPDRLERERQLLFRKAPIVVALSADVPKPSSAFSTTADGIPLLITRDRAGAVRVFVNACRHRGTQLFEGRASVPPALVCPYHAWSYKLNGEIHKRPQGETCFTGIDPAELRLRQLPSDEALGLIVARLDGQGTVDAKSWADSLAPDLAPYGLENYVHIETRHHRWDFNWKMGLDTFWESYHVFQLHKASIYKYIPSWPMVIEPRGRHMLTLTPWRSMETLDSDENLLGHATVQHLLFPNTLLSHQIDHVETWQVYPDGDNPNKCVISTSIYAPNEPANEKELAHWTRNMDVLLDVVTKEDFPQCLSIQKAIDSGATADSFVFGQNEPGVIHFHQALNEALAAGATSTSADSDPDDAAGS